jgi:hypothetical protein
MTWRGSIALILLDEFEKHITRVLLTRREAAETSMVAPTKPAERPTEEIPQEDLEKKRPCDNCGAHMQVGCGQKCGNCGWVAPCSIE